MLLSPMLQNQSHQLLAFFLHPHSQLWTRAPSHTVPALKSPCVCIDAAIARVATSAFPARLQTTEQQPPVCLCQPERRPRAGEVVLNAGWRHSFPTPAPHGPAATSCRESHQAPSPLPCPWRFCPPTRILTAATPPRWDGGRPSYSKC